MEVYRCRRLIAESHCLFKNCLWSAKDKDFTSTNFYYAPSLYRVERSRPPSGKVGKGMRRARGWKCFAEGKYSCKFFCRENKVASVCLAVPLQPRKSWLYDCTERYHEYCWCILCEEAIFACRYFVMFQSQMFVVKTRGPHLSQLTLNSSEYMQSWRLVYTSLGK